MGDGEGGAPGHYGKGGAASACGAPGGARAGLSASPAETRPTCRVGSSGDVNRALQGHLLQTAVWPSAGDAWP